MSELSHFEAESAKTPTVQPYLIMAGALLLPIVFWLLSVFAPTDAVSQLRKGALSQGAAAEAAPTQVENMDELDDEE